MEGERTCETDMASWFPDLPSVSTELGIITVVLLSFSIARQYSKKRSKKYPPGPYGLPLVGYLPFVVKNPQLKLAQLTEKFGNIVGFYLGSQYCVLLGDIASVRDAFNRLEFSGRHPRSNLAPEYHREGIPSLIGKDWMEQRKFVFRALRGFGEDKTLVEKFIKEEVQLFLDKIRKTHGKAVLVSPLLSLCTSNVMCQLLFSTKYDLHDETGEFLRFVIHEQARYTAQVAYHNFLPWVERMPIISKMLGLEHFRTLFRKLRLFFDEQVKEHEDSFDPKNIRDFTDAFLLEIKNAGGNYDNHTTFRGEVLRGTLYTLLAAGSDTIRTSLDWIFCVLATIPELQDSLRTEIDNVIGRDRLPEAKDMKRMPRVRSFIMELQRYHTIIPLNINRFTLADTELNGYDIPKHTVILSNIWALHRDAQEWEDPHTFDPDRFLAKDGSGTVKPRAYLPFSTGKRVCPGENLAYLEIFMFLTSVLQKFSFRVPEGEDLSFEAVLGVSAQTKPYKLEFIERN